MPVTTWRTKSGVVGDDRADEAAAAARRQRTEIGRPAPYGMSVVTGPNASISWGSARSPVASSTTGAMNAPRSGSASTGSTDSGSPYTVSVARPSAATAARTSSRWCRLTSAPMVTVSLRGLPTTTLSSLRAQTGDHVVNHRFGNHRPADARASLSCLGGDLSRDFLDVQVEFRRSRRGVRSRGSSS